MHGNGLVQVASDRERKKGRLQFGRLVFGFDREEVRFVLDSQGQCPTSPRPSRNQQDASHPSGCSNGKLNSGHTLACVSIRIRAKTMVDRRGLGCNEQGIVKVDGY